MTTQRITKRTVDAFKPSGSEFTVWDDAVTGFGVRVRPTRKRREKGLARSGNGRVRRGMIQLAWRFLLHQKDSALANGFEPAPRTPAARASP